MDYAVNKVNPLAPSLPVEIIFHILLLLSPQELLPLKRISKQFRSIINDRTLWSTLYAEARLLRPPGPFPWQSVEFFQRNLVRSTLLARCWTSQPMNVVSTRSLTLGSTYHWNWVCGRWLIFCRTGGRLVSHDIDTGSEQTLCLLDNKWISWSATCSTMSTRGQLLYVGLYYVGDVCSVDRVRLLEFQVENDSGYLSGPIVYDVAPRYSGCIKCLRMKSGNTPFVLVAVGPSRLLAIALIFDTQNRTFYKFPRVGSETSLSSQRRLRCSFDDIVLTTTHVIVARTDTHSHTQDLFIQAYVVLDDNETHGLRLTHETLTNNGPTWWTLLRDSAIDPVTGSTSMRLLDFRLDREFVCTELTLPVNSTEVVMPMLIDTQVVFAMESVQQDMSRKLVQASPDGLARGLCVVGSILEGYFIRKLSIDATGKRCVGVISDRSPLWPGADLHRWRIDSFDGTRGRMCYTKDGVGDERVAIAVDIE